MAAKPDLRIIDGGIKNDAGVGAATPVTASNALLEQSMYQYPYAWGQPTSWTGPVHIPESGDYWPLFGGYTLPEFALPFQDARDKAIEDIAASVNALRAEVARLGVEVRGGTHPHADDLYSEFSPAVQCAPSAEAPLYERLNFFAEHPEDFPNEEFLELAHNALTSQNWLERAAGARALGRLAGAKALDKLQHALEGETSAQVKAAIRGAIDLASL